MSSRLALCLVIQEIGGPVDPGFGNIGGIGGPVDPGFGVGGGIDPGFGRPGPGHPANRPPGSGALPTHPIYHPDKPVPPGQSPGPGVWVVAYVPQKGLHWVAITPGVPDKPVPGEPPSIDNTLPPAPQPKA